MALVVKDRVKETTTTTGTGTVTLAGAADGYQAFSAIGDGNTTYYCIVDPTNNTWEVGLGTYTSSGTTLSRDTILESSNSGSAVDFAAGAKDVFCTYPAEKAVYEDASGDVAVTGGLTASGDVAVAGTVTTTGIVTTNWTIEQSGSDIVFKHSGTTKLKLTSAGAIVAADDITAFGSP